ncbi:hypothetical protein D3C77_670030 [compost metagenome]
MLAVTRMKCSVSLAVVMAGNAPALNTTILKSRKPLASKLSKVACRAASLFSRSTTRKAICGDWIEPRWA